MDISAVLLYGWPGKEFSVGETYESLQWLSEDVPKPTLQEIENLWPECLNQIQIKIYKTELEKLLNSVAAQKDYRSQLSIVSYTSSSNPQWKAEADSFIDWRDALYSYALQVMDNVLNGNIPAPTLEDFLQGAPVIVWP
mgnify:CR=1 FL=1